MNSYEHNQSEWSEDAFEVMRQLLVGRSETIPLHPTHRTAVLPKFGAALLGYFPFRSLFGLFGPPNVEKLKAKGDVHGLIKALSYERDPSIQLAAATVLGTLKDRRAIAPLKQALMNETEEVRLKAAEVLKEIGWQPQNNAEQVALSIASGNWHDLPKMGETDIDPLETPRKPKIIKNPDGSPSIMEVLNVRIDWMESYANDPELQVLVNRTPRLQEMRFVQRDGIWYAELDGYVKFYAWRGPGNEGGFYGREFPITMVDGSQVTLKGPYSSSPSEVNRVGLGPCILCMITENPSKFKRGSGFIGGAITIEAAKRILRKFCPEAELVEYVDQRGGVRYILTRDGQLKPKQLR